MIVVNPRNQGVKNAIFRVPFGIFSTLVSVTFFWVQLDEVQLWNLMEMLDFIKCKTLRSAKYTEYSSSKPNFAFG